MSWSWRLGALLLLAVPLAWAADHKPAVLDPLPFDHETHDPELQRLGLGCVDCHGFAAAGEQPGATPVGRELCHGCHQDEVRGASPKAPQACDACHTELGELEPASHDPYWEESHGPAARSLKADCTTCHERTTCVTCHEARGALARKPHPPAFRITHGIEARLDKATCGTCHSTSTCRTCHETQGVPW